MAPRRVADTTQQRQQLANSTGQKRLLQRIETAERRLTQRRVSVTPAGMILDTLTERELDVLRLDNL